MNDDGENSTTKSDEKNEQCAILQTITPLLWVFVVGKNDPGFYEALAVGVSDYCILSRQLKGRRISNDGENSTKKTDEKN